MMSSFKARARRLAFGDSNEDNSEISSTRSSIRSTSSKGSFTGIIERSSSISEPCTCHSDEKAVSAVTRRTNRVQRVNRSQSFERFVEALEEDGCVIVEDFVNPQISQRDQIVEDLPPANVHRERETRSMEVDIHALIRESLLSDILYQTLSSHFLTLETVSWHNNQAQVNVAKPRVSSLNTRDINRIATGALQRADNIYHVPHTARQHYEYQLRRDVTLGLFVPEVDSLSTFIPIGTVPGSHLWNDDKPDLTKGIKDVQLRSGEALILLGSLYHYIGARDCDRSSTYSGISGRHKVKLMHEIWMCSGIHRLASDIEMERDEP